MSKNEHSGQSSPPPEPRLEDVVNDVTVELGRAEALDDTPPTSLTQVEQNPPEEGYYEAELKSLRSALLEERDDPEPRADRP